MGHVIVQIILLLLLFMAAVVVGVSAEQVAPAQKFKNAESTGLGFIIIAVVLAVAVLLV